jgi:kynureninase
MSRETGRVGTSPDTRRLDLDIDGPAAPPRRNGELAFEHPWQSRLFATTRALCDDGVIDDESFRRRLIARIARRPDEYWANWQDALEDLLHERGVIGAQELDDEAARFAEHSDHSH